MKTRRAIVLGLIGSISSAVLVPAVAPALSKKKIPAPKAAAAPSASVAAAWRAQTKGKGAVIAPGAPFVDPGSAPPPAPLVLACCDEREMARTARKALLAAKSAEERTAVWLGIYKAAGIPVLDESGRGIGTGLIDPLGPSLWMVSSMAVARFDQGISLRELAKLMDRGDASTDDEAAATLAKDLRDQVRSTFINVPSKFVATYIDEVALETSKGLRSEAAIDPAVIRLDLASAQFLLWATMRGSLRLLMKSGAIKAPAQKGAVFFESAVSMQAAEEKPGPQPRKCSEAFGNEQTTFLTNWLLNKFAIAGVSLPGGVDLPGVVSSLAKRLDGPTDPLNATVGKLEGGVKVVANALGIINAVFAVLSTLLQFTGIVVEGIAPKLIRTTDTKAGQQATLSLTLAYRPRKAFEGLPDAGQTGLGCLFNYVSTVLGAGATLPSEGPIAGVMVETIPGKGFGRIRFNNYKQIKQLSDANGHVDVELIGRPQPKKIPKPQAIDYVYSVRIRSTIDPLDAGTLFNFFFDSFAAVGTGSIPGGIGAIIDVLRLTPYDMAELEAPLIDWKDADEICPGKGGNYLAGIRFC
jgi:hypothetical protein